MEMFFEDLVNEEDTLSVSEEQDKCMFRQKSEGKPTPYE